MHAAQEKTDGTGFLIFSIEDLISSKPIISTMKPTTSAATYSILPWPNGCSLSGFIPAILKPTRVTMFEPASERLFSASPVIAMLRLTVPIKNFAAARIIFTIMPVTPLSIP